MADPDENACSSSACTGNITEVLQNAASIENEQEEVEIWLKITTDLATTNFASIWEINFSSSNISNKLAGD